MPLIAFGPDGPQTGAPPSQLGNPMSRKGNFGDIRAQAESMCTITKKANTCPKQPQGGATAKPTKASVPEG